ncbi:MAG TPA: S9 family peptidase [Candidatus Eisenbacteria bacterium]|nr:S9 family peptidase [Candidatus Eisenbacteria bacterium]
MMRMGIVMATAALAIAGAAWAAAPTEQQLIALPRIGAVAISPDGQRVAFTVRDTDWVGNAFVTQVWVAGENEAARPLTRGKKSSTSPQWSPDGRRLAFLSNRDDKTQVWALSLEGGDAEKLTAAPENVERFAWSPDAKSIAYTMANSDDSTGKSRAARYGEFEIVGEDHRATRLWVVDVASKRARAMTQTGVVRSFAWSPDGTRIAYDHQANEALGADSTLDIGVVELATGRTRDLVTSPGPDADPQWSPDGRTIAFQTALGDRWYYYANNLIATVPAAGGAITPLTRAFDEDADLVAWRPQGVFFAGLRHTASALFSVGAEGGAVTTHAPAAPFYGGSFSLSRDGTRVAWAAGGPEAYPEVWLGTTDAMQGRPVTHFGDAVRGWTVGRAEVVSWKSHDGATIEGVLRKPAGWKPGHKAPLLVIIHGGPTGISRPTLIGGSYVYPEERWLAKGALILEPNYRGSAGYGAAFRALNVRNLGVGDAWDVVSGVDALVQQGLADPDRVGVMGWSEGGYISAFLATHESRRFRAISVGAGISDWMTYYVNTDITPFTWQYLRATPWSDPEIYAKTSPITTVRDATTPVLIQQGDHDARVPVPDSFELWRALQDVGVPTRLVLYKGFGHGLDKPKALLAAMEHNEEWFDRWLFDAPAHPARAARAAATAGAVR